MPEQYEAQATLQEAAKDGWRQHVHAPNLPSAHVVVHHHHAWVVCRDAIAAFRMWAEGHSRQHAHSERAGVL